MSTREASITVLMSFWTVCMILLGMASVTYSLAGILVAVIGSMAVVGFVGGLACIAQGLL